MFERLKIANQYRKVTAGRNHSVIDNLRELRAGWFVAQRDLDTEAQAGSQRRDA